jgi:hypothetical protein
MANEDLVLDVARMGKLVLATGGSKDQSFGQREATGDTTKSRTGLCRWDLCYESATPRTRTKNIPSEAPATEPATSVAAAATAFSTALTRSLSARRRFPFRGDGDGDFDGESTTTRGRGFDGVEGDWSLSLATRPVASQRENQAKERTLTSSKGTILLRRRGLGLRRWCVRASHDEDVRWSKRREELESTADREGSNEMADIEEVKNEETEEGRDVEDSEN